MNCYESQTGLRRVNTAKETVDFFGGGYTYYNRFQYHSAFHTPPTREELLKIKRVLSECLASKLKQELDHIAGQDVVLARCRTMDIKLECDKCCWAFCIIGYICTDCGKEFCPPCVADGRPICSHSNSLRLFSMIDPKDLRSLIHDMEEVNMQPLPSWTHDFTKEIDPLMRTIPTLAPNPTMADFDVAWAPGVPLLIEATPEPGTLHRWTKEKLVYLFGSNPCQIEDCETDGEEDTTVATFLEMIFGSNVCTRPLKLKDYPPNSTFAAEFPTLCRSFQYNLPFPAVTTFHGALNITNYFPPAYKVAPDLGPKAYIATANDSDPRTNQGTTRLHMDLCDAANSMLPVDKDSAALWHVFAPEDASKLQEFLCSKHRDTSKNHIHAQLTYLTPEDLVKLEKDFGVRPYAFTQKAGETVLIPTGCAHQVRNLTACAKIAVDFLSSHSVKRCTEVSEQLREEGVHGKKDTLEFWNLMLHAWFAVDLVDVANPESQVYNSAGHLGGVVHDDDPSLPAEHPSPHLQGQLAMDPMVPTSDPVHRPEQHLHEPALHPQPNTHENGHPSSDNIPPRIEDHPSDFAMRLIDDSGTNEPTTSGDSFQFVMRAHSGAVVERKEKKCAKCQRSWRECKGANDRSKCREPCPLCKKVECLGPDSLKPQQCGQPRKRKRG
ncbi:hypothetical protein PTI98_009052 [Pleurotus ostreatus]|nr:hypothetical protein PTI98_009052 [Pleurotus ostreatus]